VYDVRLRLPYTGASIDGQTKTVARERPMLVLLDNGQQVSIGPSGSPLRRNEGITLIGHKPCRASPRHEAYRLRSVAQMSVYLSKVEETEWRWNGVGWVIQCYDDGVNQRMLRFSCFT